jgi:hypothetical protein
MLQQLLNIIREAEAKGATAAQVHRQAIEPFPAETALLPREPVSPPPARHLPILQSAPCLTCRDR